MIQMKEKIVGIIGGMGPEATVDLMKRIISLTPASDDIDHIRLIVDNNPKVPSRIKNLIEGSGESPGPCMADMGKRLESYGADFLVIPCNTAHHFYDSVQSAVNIPVIHMIDTVCQYVKERYPDCNKIGMLASPAVAMTGLYSDRLAKLGIQDIWPDQSHQELLLKLIKEVKTGNTGSSVLERYERVCENLKQKGAEKTIIACTELSAIGSPRCMNSVDGSQILAVEVVQVAKNKKNL